jgi:hypothetical protein
LVSFLSGRNKERRYNKDKTTLFLNFLSLLSSFLSYSIDFKAKNLIKTGDFPSLISSARTINIVYIFACPRN